MLFTVTKYEVFLKRRGNYFTHIWLLSHLKFDKLFKKKKIIDTKARGSSLHAKRKSKTKVFFCDMFCRNFPSRGKFALQHFIELSGYGVWQHSGLGLVCMCYVAIAQRFTQRCHHRNPLSPSLKVVTGAGRALQT